MLINRQKTIAIVANQIADAVKIFFYPSQPIFGLGANSKAMNTNQKDPGCCGGDSGCCGGITDWGCC
jgi:hypothetical protein